MIPAAPMLTVSVVIPTFNRAHLIGAALRSVLVQTRQPDEILVIDDGSTDETEALVRREFGERVRYIRQPNAGAAAARNHGMRLATGDLIAFLDSDDFWLPTKLEQQVAFLEAHPEFAASCGNLRMESMDGRDLGLKRPPEAAITGRQFEPIVRDPSRYHFMYIPTLVFRRSCIDQIGWFDEGRQLAEDWHFTFRLAARYPIHSIPEAVAVTRIHEGQITLNQSRQHRGTEDEQAYWSGRGEGVLISMMSSLLAEVSWLTAAQRGEMRQAIARLRLKDAVKLGRLGQFGEAMGQLRSGAFGGAPVKDTLGAVVRLALSGVRGRSASPESTV